MKNKLAHQAIRNRRKKNFIEKYKNHIVFAILLSIFAIIMVAFFKQKKQSQVLLAIDLDQIEAHNRMKLSYTLGSNYLFSNMTLLDAKYLMNNQLTLRSTIPICHLNNIQIPSQYDFKQHFPNCNHEVFYQGNCSSSYNIAAASSISDRFCRIHNSSQLSPQSLLSCEGKLNLGCAGGYLTKSLDFIIKQGLTTLDCFQFEGIERYENCAERLADCPIFKIKDYCQIKEIEQIKQDIYLNGPLSAVIYVYQDFLAYKDGIYFAQNGMLRFSNGHAVKIYGWGNDDNQNEFWLIENSWGESWGQNGLGKMYMQGEFDIIEAIISPIL